MDSPLCPGYPKRMATDLGVRFLDRTTPPHISTLILLAGIGALTMNIFLPSLPGMARAFDADYQLVQLSVALYLGMNAVLQLIIGPLSDRFGRRPVVLGALMLFSLASVGCALSQNIYVFLAFRMIQAVVVTGLVLSRAIVRDMVPQDQAASMIGYVTMGMAVVPMIGPAFGGLLDEAFGWESNFWLLALLGVAIIALVWRDLGETAPMANTSIAQQLQDTPELFRSQRFWGYCLAALFASGAFFAYLGGAPYVGSDIFGLSQSTVGILFGAPAVGYMIGNGVSGRYSKRFGIDIMILWGTIITVIGLGVALISHYAGLRTPLSFFGFMTFIGLGNGLVVPNTMAGMLSVRPHLAGTASGVGGALMLGGGAALSAFAGWILTQGTTAAPLLWTMVVTSALSVVAILAVIRRARHLKEL
ncbi:MAG: multidrug effflux MFS transporter [Pseudomonadota bacterium]